MSTWWSMPRRTDIGFDQVDLPGRPFAVTNRGWYILYRFLQALRVHNPEAIARDGEFIPSALAQHWGSEINSASNWQQVGRYDGRSVTVTGIVHDREAAELRYTHELTPLLQTPLGAWLMSIGQELATTPTGYVINGKPRKENPMSVSLSKGGNVNLTKEDPGLREATVGLGWDARTTDGTDFDLDASALMVGGNDKVVTDAHFIFYGNKTSPDGSVVHGGDNLTGQGDGDDEKISINLAAVPAEVEKIVFVASIHEANTRKQNFGQVKNAFIRVMNKSTGIETARFDLTEDMANETAMIFGEIYRHGGEWKFKAIGQGYSSGLAGVATDFGVNVA